MRYKKYLKESVIKPYVKLLEFPELRQTYDFDCGSCALHSILLYYGNNIDEGTILKMLKNIEKKPEGADSGADIPDLIKIAEHYGIEVESRENMTIIDLVNAINSEWPILVEVQAYPDDPDELNWKEDDEYGHYCVVIGYDKENIYFEDPGSYKRTYMSFKEMDKRWHGYGEKDKIYNHWGMICKGIPNFKANDVEHFE